MILLDELIEIDELATAGSKSAADLHRAMEGLEARIRENIRQLDKPRAQTELQGLADFLLMAVVGVKKSCGHQCAAFVTLGDVTRHHIAAVREIVGNT